MATKQIAPDKTQLMNEMRMEVAERLIEIEDVFKNYGLPLTGITLVARDPANDNMIVVLTNEDGAGRKRALELGITDGMNTLDGDGQWKGTRVLDESRDVGHPKEYVVTSDEDGLWYVVAAEDFHKFDDLSADRESLEGYRESLEGSGLDFIVVGHDPSFVRFTGYRIDES